MDPACAAPEESAESGERPEEQPNRLATAVRSERPEVQPKRQRERHGARREKDRTERATKPPST